MDLLTGIAYPVLPMYDRSRMLPLPISAPPPSMDAAHRPAPESHRQLNRRTLNLILISFPILGAATVMLGPTLPLFAARWRMPDAQLGTLFLAAFAGQFSGAWLATPRVRASLVIGAFAAAAGMLMLTFAGPGPAHLALFFAGLGLGAGMTAGNVVVGISGAEQSGRVDRGNASRSSPRSRNLAWLNVLWGLGAICCPLLLEASLRIGAEPGRIFFAGLGLAMAACGVMLARFLPPPAALIDESREVRRDIPWHDFLLFAAMLMLYVGVENALAGWLPTYAHRLSPGAAAGGKVTAIAFCFWSCELAGRGLTALVIQRTNERVVYRTALVALLAVSATTVLVPRPGTLSIFAITSVAAISLAPLYPLAVSFLLAQTGNHPHVGKIFAGASLGGMVLPWLTGVVSTHFHTLRIGFAAPAVGAALLLALSLCLPRAGRVKA